VFVEEGRVPGNARRLAAGEDRFSRANLLEKVAPFQVR
jgi:hypothetical protein